MTEKHVEHREERPEHRRRSRVPEWSRHPAWMLATLVLVVVVAATFLLKPPSVAPAPEARNVSAAPKSNVSLQVETYLTENFFQSQGLRAEVMSLEDYGNDLFLATVAVKNGTETMQTAPLLVTKSGDFVLLAPTHYVLNTTKKLELPSAATPTPQAIPKLAKPEVKMFVMSFCPYGQEAEKMSSPVVNLLKDSVNITLHYIVSGPTYCDVLVARGAYATKEECLKARCFNGTLCSMHGAEEAAEDARQLCIFKYAREKLWKYLDYVNAECTVQTINNCWKKAAENATIDEALVERCMSNEGAVLLAADAAIADSYGVQGSETLFVNEVRVNPAQYRFSSEKLKKILCDAFTTPPAECSQTIAAGTISGAPSGSCG